MFFVFEGVGCSGKSTQSKLLAKSLSQKGYHIVVTSEPYFEEINDLVTKFSFNRSKIMLFLAQHYENYVDLLPYLSSKDTVVISDRYVDSTLVYQGYIGGENLTTIRRFYTMLCSDYHFLRPDKTFLLDVGATEFELRMASRTKTHSKDLFNIRYVRKIKAAYLHLAEQSPDSYEIIYTTHSSEAETAEIVLFKALELLN